jgi:DNA-dependent RNA polymerase
LDIANLIFDSGHLSKIYSNNPKIIKKVQKKDGEMADILLNHKNSTKLNVILNHLKNIQSMVISKDKLSKWSEVNISIFDTIELILESGITNEEKQIGVEKAIFEYDNEFFINNMKTTSNEIKIFSQEYINISKNYDNIINDYIKYRAIKLKKLFNSDKTDAIIILMLIYMSKDRIISLVFKFILDRILFNDQYFEGINKTILLFLLAKYIKKIFMLGTDENNKVLKSVENICSYSELKGLIKNFNDIDYIKLGDTLYYLINQNSKFIENKLISKNPTNREIVVNINPIYINKLISSNISLSLLPMVSKPKDVEEKGEYYPYLLNNTNVLALDECKVIKGKYDQRYYSKGSVEFYEGINYINNIKYKINNNMLKFVLTEWKDKESILFKGFNLSQEIYESDSPTIKREKRKHNALHSLYYNIIHIAYLFRNQTFFLPVYADFRGRIYTLSNYLSYQGNDLARSLLLFDSEESLNKKGLECLNIYFSNLAGFDKLSWEDRLNKSNEVTLEFLEASFDYLNKNSKDGLKNLINKVSEPFQYISIGLAKTDYLINQKAGKISIIRNPILFDASCSGIQHISALTLDKNLAKYSNVFTDKLNPSAEIPEDFYKYALELINDKLLKSENPNIKNIKLKRNTIKRTVMTIPYNISLTGIGEQLEEHFKKVWILNKYEFFIPDELALNGKSFSITSREFGLFTKIIFEILSKDIPSLKNLTNYFKNIINISNRINLPVY